MPRTSRQSPGGMIFHVLNRGNARNQGTYKSFLIEEDDHLYTVLRYVERNPVRPTLVERAEDWQWSSLWRWLHPEAHHQKPILCPWPNPRPQDWVTRVNRALTKK